MAQYNAPTPLFLPETQSEVLERDFDDADFELLYAQDYWAGHSAQMEA